MVRFTDTVLPLGGRNLVPNGSFEIGTAGWSSLGLGAGQGNGWWPVAGDWGNFDCLHGEVVERGAPHGRSFLRIRLGGAHTPVFSVDYFEPVNRRELRPLAASVGWIEVTPGEPYTLSLDMRASRDGVGGAFGIRSESPRTNSPSARALAIEHVALTRQWKRYWHTFTPKHPFVFVVAGPDLTCEEDVAVDLDAIQLERGAQATAFAPRDNLEIGVVPAAPAGVFTSETPAALKITAFNNGAAPAHVRIGFNISDFADQPVALPDVVLAVPANAAVEKRVRLPADWRGFYRVVAGWKTGNREEARLLRLAIIPPRATRETFVGVNHAYPNSSLLQLAAKAGVTWCRDWSLKWQQIEPEKGKYQWAVSDPQINRVAAQRLSLLGMIPFPSTDWNSTAPELETLKAASPRYRAGGRGRDQELLSRARWAWPPREVSELTAYIKAAVNRYRNQVQVWEFLNEPVYTSYALPDAAFLNGPTLHSHTARDYLELLRPAATAIRAANPRARIIGGPGQTPSGRYVVPMVEAGVLDSVDIYSLHDYPGTNQPETRIPALDKLLAAMNACGGPKPIWMTEFSYYGSDDLPRKPFVPMPGSWSESRLLSEQQVANYTIRYFTIFLGRGGEKIFLHSGCTGAVNQPGTENCLFGDGAVRKLFAALAVFTEVMGPHPQFAGDNTGGGGGGLMFAFETGKQAALVLWDPDNRTTVPIPAGTACKDLMGRKRAGPTVGLSSSPVYILGPPGYAKRMLAACAESNAPKPRRVVSAAP